MATELGNPAEQQKRASVKEGLALADIYANSTDIGAADKQVQKRLLTDAYMAQHGEFNMAMVNKTLVEAVNKQNNPDCVLKQDAYGNVSRQGFVLPVLNIEFGKTQIFDWVEANKAIDVMEKDKESMKANSSKPSGLNYNVFDGTMGAADLINKIVNTKPNGGN